MKHAENEQICSVNMIVLNDFFSSVTDSVDFDELDDSLCHRCF